MASILKPPAGWLTVGTSPCGGEVSNSDRGLVCPLRSPTVGTRTRSGRRQAELGLHLCRTMWGHHPGRARWVETASLISRLSRAMILVDLMFKRTLVQVHVAAKFAVQPCSPFVGHGEAIGEARNRSRLVS